MAEDLLRELRPFVLSNVRLTGTRIGTGAYGSVEEVAIPGAICAAKKIHEIFLDPSEVRPSEIRKTTTQFVRECQLMSTLRHPHIVQFVGVCFFPGSRLPALVMERLLISLHDLLDPEIDPPPPPDALKPLFPLSLKCSILHNVASGLAYLHERSPPIIHRDLSARNVLLNSGMVAKVADLGVARMVPDMRAAATMTKAPGASVYMPPEATAPSASNKERSKYDASIDIFSFGVVTIFTIGETFPCDPLAPTYLNESSGLLVARTELQRRSGYMGNVNTHLRACGQLCEGHPLIRLIQQCLHNGPHKRPNIGEVLHLLEEARAGIRDEESERNRREPVQALQTQHRDQNLEQVLQELTELQQQLQSREREKHTIIQQLTAELTRAEETIRREQQQRQQKDRELAQAQQRETEKDELVQAKDRELAKAQQQLREKETEKDELVQAKDRELAKAQQQLREKEEQLRCSEADLSLHMVSYTCQVSGPGLQSATVNHATHVIVELTDSSGRPASLTQNITAQLETVMPTETSRLPWSKKPKKQHSLSVAMTTPSQYEITYTAVSRGQHTLHVHVNDREISDSPFSITVYPDPTQVGRPVRTVIDLIGPYGIAINRHGGAVISECYGHRVSIFDIRGQKIRTFGSRGDSLHQMKSPTGIAIDEKDNIYVSSYHKLQKFTSNGELIMCVGQEGRKEGEFDNPRGVTLYNNQVYVCDRDNHRIQVFDLDLNFVRSISSHGPGRGEFDKPRDVKFDTAANMYVTEYGNERVQVMDISGHFIQSFGQEGEGKLAGPSGLHIADKFVYVTDVRHHCIVVYETSGQFVTKFSRRGHRERELNGPHCITSCTDGFIHVCDCLNDRVQIL